MNEGRIIKCLGPRATQDIAIHFILFTLSSKFIYNLWEVLLGRHYLRNNLIKNLILIKCHVNYYSFKILLWVILSLWSSGSSHPNYTFYNYNFLFCFLLVGGTLDTKGLIKSWDWWCTKGKGKVNRFYQDFCDGDYSLEIHYLFTFIFLLSSGGFTVCSTFTRH